MIKKLLFVLLIFNIINCNAQLCFNDIDLSKIPQKEIKDLLMLQYNCNIRCISDLEASYTMQQNAKDYYKQVRTYRLKESLESVWENYNNNSPTKIYTGSKFSFGLMLSKTKSNNSIMYNSDAFSKIEQGQVLYLKLDFLKGIYSMAVAFEITAIDSIKHTIEFSYVKGGCKASGKQTLQFEKCKNGETKITHTSLYKSKSTMRDMILYPFFHAKITNAFHRKLKNIIAKSAFVKSQPLAG